MKGYINKKSHPSGNNPKVPTESAAESAVNALRAGEPKWASHAKAPGKGGGGKKSSGKMKGSY